MKIVVITDDVLKQELLAQGLVEDVQIEWQSEINPVAGADGYIDLLFNLSAERIDQLKKLQPATIIVNSVSNTLAESAKDFVRINGWNSFLKRLLIEMTGDEQHRTMAENIFSCFNKTAEWVPDVPGLISARVISTIINEAYFTLEEKISTKVEIDTAMRFGTNYPYGPFEWGEKIGLMKVYQLLSILAETNSRYTPSALLQLEALS